MFDQKSVAKAKVVGGRVLKSKVTKL